MIRKKVISLAAIAIAVLSASAAPSAQATEFHAGAEPVVITGTNHPGQTFTYTLTDTKGNNVNAECAAATLEGTSPTKTFQELTLTMTLGPECTLFGVNSTVRMNGCKYTITNTVPTTSKTGLVDITGCTAGKKIEIISAVCKLTFGEQAGLSHLVFKQTEAMPKEVDVEATLSSIVSTQDGAACPDGNGETRANASFHANTTLKAFVDTGTAQVTKHSHQYTEHKCGAQVDLIVT